MSSRPDDDDDGPRRRRKWAVPDGLTVDGVLGPDGALSAAMPGYEHRPTQLEMARSVAHALETKRFLLAEAGRAPAFSPAPRPIISAVSASVPIRPVGPCCSVEPIGMMMPVLVLR